MLAGTPRIVGGSTGGGGGDPTIGNPVIGGTPGWVLYIDQAGNLAGDNLFTSNSITKERSILFPLGSYSSGLTLLNTLPATGVTGTGIQAQWSPTAYSLFQVGDFTPLGGIKKGTTAGYLDFANGNYATWQSGLDSTNKPAHFIDAINGTKNANLLLNNNGSQLKYTEDGITKTRFEANAGTVQMRLFGSGIDNRFSLNSTDTSATYNGDYLFQVNGSARTGFLGPVASGNQTAFGYDDSQSYSYIKGLAISTTTGSSSFTLNSQTGGSDTLTISGSYSASQSNLIVKVLAQPGQGQSITQVSGSLPTITPGMAVVQGGNTGTVVAVYYNVGINISVAPDPGSGDIVDGAATIDGNPCTFGNTFVAVGIGYVLSDNNSEHIQDSTDPSTFLGLSLSFSGSQLNEEWNYVINPVFTYGTFAEFFGSSQVARIGDTQEISTTTLMEIDIANRNIYLQGLNGVAFGDFRNKGQGTYGLLSDSNQNFGIYNSTTANTNAGLYVDFDDLLYWLGPNGYGTNNRLELNGGDATFYGLGNQQSAWLRASLADRQISIGDPLNDFNGTYQKTDDVAMVNISSANNGFREVLQQYDGDVTRIQIHKQLTSAEIQSGNSSPIDLGLPASGSGYFYRVKSFDARLNYGGIDFTSTALRIGPSSITTAYQAVNSVLQNTVTFLQTSDIIGSSAVAENDTLSISADANSATGNSTVDVYVTVEKVRL